MESLLTVKDVAGRLGIGRTTVYELISSRELRTIKIGRSRRIPESAVEEWIAQQVRTQTAERESDLGLVEQ